jgi:hypothetical protein
LNEAFLELQVSPKRRGLHVAGFKRVGEDQFPRVYHVRTDKEDQYRVVRAYVDYPDGMQDPTYARLAGSGRFVLRNGYHSLYSAMLESADQIAKAWKDVPNFNWPSDSIDDRSGFLSLMVKFIAQALREAEKHPAVNAEVSLVAFTPFGIFRESLQNMENDTIAIDSTAEAEAWTM